MTDISKRGERIWTRASESIGNYGGQSIADACSFTCAAILFVCESARIHANENVMLGRQK